MIRILLVEDDPVIRDTTSYFLNCQQNFEVVCADTGGEALSHAREKFDVILMDILLPDTNGMELCQRLRSWYHCAAFTLDPNSHCVEKDGRSIHLADMEYRILTLFIRHPNTFFTANELYRKIWGKESLGDVRTVQVHIHNLRSKIEPDPAKPIYLKNVWGKGYIFRPEGETEA